MTPAARCHSPLQGRLTAEGLGAVGEAALAARDVSSLGRKALVRSVAKSAAISAVKGFEGGAEGDDGTPLATDDGLRAADEMMPARVEEEWDACTLEEGPVAASSNRSPDGDTGDGLLTGAEGDGGAVLA